MVLNNSNTYFEWSADTTQIMKQIIKTCVSKIVVLIAMPLDWRMRRLGSDLWILIVDPRKKSDWLAFLCAMTFVNQEVPPQLHSLWPPISQDNTWKNENTKSGTTSITTLLPISKIHHSKKRYVTSYYLGVLDSQMNHHKNEWVLRQENKASLFLGRASTASRTFRFSRNSIQILPKRIFT